MHMGMLHILPVCVKKISANAIAIIAIRSGRPLLHILPLILSLSKGVSGRRLWSDTCRTPAREMKGRCAGERSPGFLYNMAVLTELTPVEWDRESVRLLDQSRLPWEEAFLELRTVEEVGLAIREMRVRGAPAIGVAAAYGMALAAAGLEAADRESDLAVLQEAARELAAARPTAVNLQWAVDRMMRAAEQSAQTPI